MSVIKPITAWLRNYLTNNERKCFVVGVSGGVDSAVGFCFVCSNWYFYYSIEYAD